MRSELGKLILQHCLPTIDIRLLLAQQEKKCSFESIFSELLEMMEEKNPEKDASMDGEEGIYIAQREPLPVDFAKINTERRSEFSERIGLGLLCTSSSSSHEIFTSEDLGQIFIRTEWWKKGEFGNEKRTPEWQIPYVYFHERPKRLEGEQEDRHKLQNQNLEEKEKKEKMEPELSRQITIVPSLSGDSQLPGDEGELENTPTSKKILRSTEGISFTCRAIGNESEKKECVKVVYEVAKVKNSPGLTESASNSLVILPKEIETSSEGLTPKYWVLPLNISRIEERDKTSYDLGYQGTIFNQDRSYAPKGLLNQSVRELDVVPEESHGKIRLLKSEGLWEARYFSYQYGTESRSATSESHEKISISLPKEEREAKSFSGQNFEKIDVLANGSHGEVSVGKSEREKEHAAFAGESYEGVSKGERDGEEPGSLRSHKEDKSVFSNFRGLTEVSFKKSEIAKSGDTECLERVWRVNESPSGGPKGDHLVLRMDLENGESLRFSLRQERDKILVSLKTTSEVLANFLEAQRFEITKSLEQKNVLALIQIQTDSDSKERNRERQRRERSEDKSQKFTDRISSILREV